MDKILFICEGEETERKFCNLIIDRYFIDNKKPKEYVAFGANIYSLYDEMSKDRDLDIIELIREKAKLKKDMATYEKLTMGGFDEVYLIFDYDFHAPQYSFEKILEMAEFFDNETENGKLYINYPMMESFKHFKSIPDEDFNNYKISKEECLKYKKIVGDVSCIKHFNDITLPILGIMIKQVLDKYGFISKKKLNNYETYLNEFSQSNLLHLQNKSLSKDGKIFVLNTSILWGLDYFGKDKFDEYNKIEFD
jgi:predicted RND superfamily exporter protein|uniref:hypothetical protein n=1 Tax=Candidatus Onthocola sp. TaxID=3085646 RepID=UPI003FEF6C43